MKIIGLMLAGGLGALARYSLTLALAQFSARGGMPAFPFATLLINTLGSFALALVATLALSQIVSEEWRVVLGTGFLGAFTTYSTFALESEELMTRGQHIAAWTYISLTIALGLIAIIAGRALATMILNRS